MESLERLSKITGQQYQGTAKQIPLSRRSWSVLSNDFLCAIVHSSHTISLHCCKTFAISDVLEMLHVSCSLICIINGNFSSSFLFVFPNFSLIYPIFHSLRPSKANICTICTSHTKFPCKTQFQFFAIFLDFFVFFVKTFWRLSAHALPI